MNSSESKRFLFVWWEGGGNMPPALHLVRELIERGHQVHALSDPVSEPAFRDAGASFAPLRRPPHRKDHNPAHDPMRDWEAKSPKRTLEILRDRMIFGPAIGFADDTLEQIRDFQPDAMAIMDLTFGAMVAAERARVPSAVIAPHILAYPVPGRPPFGPGFQPARNMFSRLRDRLVSRMSARILSTGLPEFNRLRLRYGLQPVSGVFDQVFKMDRLLVLTSPSLELPGGPLPANVRYVGPVLNDPAWAGDWVSPWDRDSPEPKILVSFSTTFQDQAPTLHNVIAGLGQLPVKALVTVGPAMRKQRFSAPENVTLRESAPHSRVLPEVALMITHAGHGSVVRALAQGVPLICVPMGRDQNDIAARVVYHGAGLRLPRTASPGDFSLAVERALQHPELRKSARDLGLAIRRDASHSTAIQELEQLARGGVREARTKPQPEVVVRESVPA